MMMMAALGLRAPLSVKEYNTQVWLGQIMGHHSDCQITTFNFMMALLSTSKKKERQTERKREINTQT